MEDITSQAYLWVPDNKQSDIVVISAHGAWLNNSPTFTPPTGSVFKFYSYQTQSAYGTLVKALQDDTVTEKQGSGHTHRDQVDDYVLSKFQGRHGNDEESYQEIRKFVDEYEVNVLSLRNRTGRQENKSGKKRTLSVLTHEIDRLFTVASWDFRCLFCRVMDQPVRVEVLPLHG
jgi:hypothetical protein